jgi:DUF971 family protein
LSDPSPLPPGEPWPAELRVQNNGAQFKVTFDDGVIGSISAERLREASPSADKSRNPPPPGQPLAIIEVEQVGNYAVRIGFNDGHDTGIYTWRLLRSLTTH